jgi:hypothetical protein
MPVHQEGAVRPDLRATDIAVPRHPNRAVVTFAPLLDRSGPLGIRLEEAAPPDVSGGALRSRLNRRWPCDRGTK